ncbi:MAG: thioredoxin fold domain-containing protein [Armatimonadota bacterium]|nr:thioredoxin fold domain-containing protein [Armatimonadota bacterium]MDR7475906.1 thioredoxin fold domain-containing protein [Armatimonadota bacterium]
MKPPRWVWVALVWAALALPGSAAGRGIEWRRWEEGVGISGRVGRHLLAYFHDPACRFCRRMDAKTFTAPEVQKVAQRCFVPVRVEIAGLGPEGLASAQLVQRYRVLIFPTLLVLDFRNPAKELMRLKGYVDPKDLVDFLRYVTDRWYREMSFDAFVERLLNGRLPARATGMC